MAIPQSAIDRMIDGQLSPAEIKAFNTRNLYLCDQCGLDITRHVIECLPLYVRRF